MPRVLHLLRDPTNRTARDVIARHAADPAVRLSVVLLEETPDFRESLPGEVYRLDADRTGSRASPHPSINHAQLLYLIFTADTVVAW